MKAVSLNGSVHSQGIKVDVDAWLDMGSKAWQETSDELKAAAYQAAKVCGWTDYGLKAIMIRESGSRIDQFMADVTIGVLHDLADKHPVEIEQVYEAKKETPRFKVHGSDATITLQDADGTKGE